ncbi:hypothetical protein HELRODRAFT_68312, partial [Helobdella robusta]|uniref:Squalene synthase n=1 Tax=Helobdella robusta TaxID=6412 RepID=T1FZC9_HELRO
SSGMKTCYEFLKKTSRSFYAVIEMLNPEIKDAMCLFYLVLRALDTVEDDMTIEKSLKIKLLSQFHKFLYAESWNFTKSCSNDRIVLENFSVISKEFRHLNKKYREIISKICMKMGKGMIKFSNSSPQSLKELDEYCHYVAGLVGIGCTSLFTSSGLETNNIKLTTDISNSLGLFLQKTNIIRDYLEDVNQNRYFWPKQVWSKYVENIEYFSKPEFSREALQCLNELITNALAHVSDVINYLSAISDESVFRFTAIPQVMAIATLERCYNNVLLFNGVVKIRKGEAICLMNEATNITKVKLIFMRYLNKIRYRITARDPSAIQTMREVERAMQICNPNNCERTSTSFKEICICCIILAISFLFVCWRCSVLI